MLEKRAKIIQLKSASIIDRDMLLFGPKKASFIKHDISEDLVMATSPMNIVAELENGDPDQWVIARARAIDAGGSDMTGETYYGANDNGDYFSEEDLLIKNADGKHAFETFIGCCIFTNHQNDDVEKARGKIVNAFYDKKNHCVYTDFIVDAKAYPQLARGIHQGYISDVSMGCSVKYSICSVCGNKAYDEKSYCSHVKDHKGKIVNGQRVYEKNKGIKFIELSAVTDGACENCTIQNVYTGSELLCKLKDIVAIGNEKIDKIKESMIANTNILKFASKSEDSDDFVKYSFSILSNTLNSQIALMQIQDNFKTTSSDVLMKEAGLSIDNLIEERRYLRNILKDYTMDSTKKIVNARMAKSIVKTASGEDIDRLNQALELLKKVAAQILNSKDVDFDFLEDIGGLLSELQVLIVSLVEAGFANSSIQGEGEGEQAEPGQVEPETPEMPSQPDQPKQPAPTAPAPDQNLPLAAKNINKNEKYAERIKGFNDLSLEVNDLMKNILGVKEMSLSQKDKNRKAASEKISAKFAQILEERIMNDDAIHVTEGPYSVSIDMNKGIDGYVENKKVASLSVDDLDSDLLDMAKINPHVIAGRLIQQLSDIYSKNGDHKMEKQNIKEALLTSKPPVEKVQERQLSEMGGNFSWKNDPTKTEGQVAVTTEKQLENIPQSEETGKGSFDRIRPEGIKENLETTEAQLSGPRPTNFGVDRDAEDENRQIQERQLSESGFGSERWENNRADSKLPTTEKQFEGKDRSGKALNEVQEGQLEGHRQGGDNSSKVIEAFVNGLAKIAVANKISPKTLANIKISSSGIKSPSTRTVSAQLTADDVKSLAETSIHNEIGVNMDLADEYLDETIETLYEDKEILSNEIKDVADKYVADIQNKLSSEEGLDTIEEQRKASVKSAWMKRHALSHSKTFVVDAKEITMNGGKNTQLSTIEQQAADIINEKYEKNSNITVEAIQKVEKLGSGNWQITYEVDSDDMNVNNNEISNNEMRSNESQMEQPNAVSASVIERLKKLAQENEMKKVAQSPQGTTMPAPAGGAPGADAMAPAPEAGLDNLGGEAPATDDIVGDTMDMEEGEGSEGEAKPFGTVCPACGSDDVDAMDGEFKCNACGQKYNVEIKINLDPETASGVNESTEGEGEEDEESFDGMEEETEGSAINDQLNAAPAAAPVAAPAPAPMAHSNGWIRNASLRYVISEVNPVTFMNKGKTRKAGIAGPIGQICTQCSSNRVAFKESVGTCVDCGCKHHVKAENNNGSLKVTVTVLPNLTLAEKERTLSNGNKIGYAVTAECEDCDEVKKALHEILSYRKDLIKVASSIYQTNPLLACMSDQIGNGFSEDDSINVCASIKDLFVKKALLTEDDEDIDDEDEDIKDEDVNIEDEDADIEEIDTEDESEDEDADIEEIDDEDESEDEDVEEVEFEFGDEDGDEDDIEFESEDGTDFENEPSLEDIANVTGVTINFEDANGESGVLEISNNDLFDNDDNGEKDITIVEEEVDFDNDEDIDFDNEEEGEFEDGEEIDGEEIMKHIFTPVGNPNDEECEGEECKDEECEGEECEEDEEAKFASNLMRNDRIASSNRVGGSNLDFNKLAKSLGLKKASMPLDTEADVPRDEESGMIEDGFPVSTSDYKNTAKQMKGTAAGSSLQNDKAINPKASGKKVIIKAEYDDEDKVHVNKGKWKAMINKVLKPTELDEGIDQGDIDEETEQELKNFKAKASSKKRSIKKAQNDKTMPLDVIEEKEESSTLNNKIDIPRNKAKSNPEINTGRKDITNPNEVMKGEYKLGPDATNLHNDSIVPRDSSGDGLGGKKPKFDTESWTNQTSGDADNYVQKIQKENIIAPTPAGNKDNHAIAAKKDFAIRKVATAKNISAKNLQAIVSPEGNVIVQNTKNNKLYTVTFKK